MLIRDFPNGLLAQCLGVKSDVVRLHAVKLLIERGELAEAAAHDLLTDTNYETRLLAVECLQSGDNPLPDDTAKAVLTIKRGSSSLGFLGTAETDTTYYDRYRKSRLQELDFDQLTEQVRNVSIFNDKELLAFYGKFSRQVSGDIRANLTDQFATMFEASVKKAEAIPGLKENFRTEVYKIWDFYQKKLCSGALAVLCNLKVKSDIGLVRATIDAVEIELSPELLAYLAKFGDWSDVSRIKRLSSPLGGKRGLLNLTYEAFADEKAKAIFELGKVRIADLLNADLSAPIRKALTKLLPRKIFGSLSNDTIINELDRKDDEYRVLFSMRCVESLPKERIEKIVNLYIERDTQRYYNSIHWLDLGASLSKKDATAIIRRELVRRSQ